MYKFVKIRNTSAEEIRKNLTIDINLKQPVVFDLRELNFEISQDFITTINYFFKSKGISFKYPYPLYIISNYDYENSEITIFQNEKDLPRFFSKKNSKTNLRESQLVSKTRLLQQEIKNSDPTSYELRIKNFSKKHKIIFQLEIERQNYQKIITELLKEE